MAKKNFEDKKQQKVTLGQNLSMLRIKKEISLRELAFELKLSPSNVTYIEKGVNVPTPEVYDAILKVLSPSNKERDELDLLYMQIRNLPPPDVCNIILQNKELIQTIRNTIKTDR